MPPAIVISRATILKMLGYQDTSVSLTSKVLCELYPHSNHLPIPALLLTLTQRMPFSLMLHPNLGASLVPLLACYDLYPSGGLPRARTAYSLTQCFAGQGAGASRLLAVPSLPGLPHSSSLVRDCKYTLFSIPA